MRFRSLIRSTVRGKVREVVDKNVPPELRGVIDGIFGRTGLGHMGGARDRNLSSMKSISKQMVQTNFRSPWQFRVEIDGAPRDWDLYCKEVVQTPFELEAAEQRVGAHYLSYLNGIQPVSLSLTMRDNEDGRIYNWFKQWVDSVVYPDGTWGLPIEYLRTVRIYVRQKDGSEYLRQEHRVEPLTLGEITETLESGGGLLEFPITMKEFRGFGTHY